MEEDERVLAVGLFGSLARGDALPSSDADILLVLRSHNLPRWFDRIPEYASKFHESTLPVEVFPYTHKELTSLMANPGFVRTAMDEIVLLAGDPMIFARLLDLNGNL
jgi:UTP:GlnB (protein PII) uridylyltransferase